MTERKVLTVNPIKKSRVLGSTLAFLGIPGAMAVHHGSQGCTAFTKNFLTQHFREIIPMQTTALTDVATIMGDDRNLFEGLKNVLDKHNPILIGLITTGITEVRGDDLKGSLDRFYQQYPEYSNVPVIPVPAPDFEGDAEAGYADAVAAITAHIPSQAAVDTDRVLVLPNFSMNPGEVRAIEETIELFGLTAECLPNPAETLSGISAHYSSKPQGEPIRLLSAGQHPLPGMVIGIGESMRDAVEAFAIRIGVPYAVFPSLMGIQASDEFIETLRSLSGRDVPKKLLRERALAVDALLDSHFYLTERQAVIALEPDAAYAFAKFYRDELGVAVKAAVVSHTSAVLENIPAEKVMVGDFADVELACTGADILVASTNGVIASKNTETPLLRVGYPVKDRLGAHLVSRVLYEGARNAAYELANEFIQEFQHS